MLKRAGHADGAVDTHSKHAGIVEEDHPEVRSGILRWAKNGPDQDLRSSRLENHGRSKMIEFRGEPLGLRGDRAVAEVRSSFDDHSGGFAFGMAVDHSDGHDAEGTRAGGLRSNGQHNQREESGENDSGQEPSKSRQSGRILASSGSSTVMKSVTCASKSARIFSSSASPREVYVEFSWILQ